MKSFRDPITNVLTAWGTVETNGDDLARDEPDTFLLEPGRWQLVDDQWQPYEPPAAIPQSVTRRQGRLALLKADKLDAVEAIIEAIPTASDKRAAQIEYEANIWERSNSFLQSIWNQLGGTEADLDSIFMVASTL